MIGYVFIKLTLLIESIRALMCPSKISCISSSSKSGKGVLKHSAIFLKSAESYGLYKQKCLWFTKYFKQQDKWFNSYTMFIYQKYCIIALLLIFE